MHESPQFSRSYPPNAAIAQYARVKLLSTGKIDVAVLADEAIGIAGRPASAADATAGTPIAVHHFGRIVKVIAAEALAAGARLHSAAAGKVADTAAVGSFPQGVALEAATADLDVIDMMVLPDADAS